MQPVTHPIILPEKGVGEDPTQYLFWPFFLETCPYTYSPRDWYKLANNKICSMWQWSCDAKFASFLFFNNGNTSSELPLCQELPWMQKTIPLVLCCIKHTKVVIWMLRPMTTILYIFAVACGITIGGTTSICAICCCLRNPRQVAPRPEVGLAAPNGRADPSFGPPPPPFPPSSPPVNLDPPSPLSPFEPSLMNPTEFLVYALFILFVFILLIYLIYVVIRAAKTLLCTNHFVRIH